MKGQKGQVYLLVLGLLALGALIIVPALQYTATAQISRRVSKDALTRQAAADATVEQALWQMLNDILSSGTPETGDFTFDLGNFSITVPAIPDSRNQGTPPVRYIFFVVDPKMLQVEDTSTINYIMAFDTQQWETLTNFGFILPKNLEYLPNSTEYWGPMERKGGTQSYTISSLDVTADNVYWNWERQVDLVNHKVKTNAGWQLKSPGSYVEVYDGLYPLPGTPQPNTSYLLITTEADGRQKLDWKPYFSIPASRRVFIQTATVTGNPGWGIHYISAWFYGQEAYDPDQTAALGSAFYSIIVPVGGVTYEVIVAYDSTAGTFKIISYREMG